MQIDSGYILNRLSEPSTWRAFGIALSAFGVNMEDDTLIAIGLGISALIGIFVKDKA